MLQYCAEKIVDQLFKHCDFPEKRRPVYIYGAELTLSTLLGCISVLLVSLLLGNILIGLSFLFCFISIRLFSGGYHANTYFSCFLTTNTTFICVYILSQILNTAHNDLLSLFLLIMDCIIIVSFTPVRNIHHPLSEEKSKRNRIISIILTLVEICAVLLIYLFCSNFAALSVAVASFTAIAVMMIIPKVQERREKYVGNYRESD